MQYDGSKQASRYCISYITIIIMEKRNRKITFRTSENEYQKILRKADESNLKLSDYIRFVSLFTNFKNAQSDITLKGGNR